MNPVIIITGASRGIGAATAILEQIQVLGAIDTLTIGLSREVAGEGI